MINDIKIPHMATIIEAAQLTGLAKWHIRQLVQQNKIKHVRTGKKYLINVEKLIEYLNEGESQETVTLNTNNITKIEK